MGLHAAWQLVEQEIELSNVDGLLASLMTDAQRLNPEAFRQELVAALEPLGLRLTHSDIEVARDERAGRLTVSLSYRRHMNVAFFWLVRERVASRQVRLRRASSW